MNKSLESKVLGARQKIVVLSHILTFNFHTMKIPKQKIYEIIVTAIVGALIAMLQGLLAAYLDHSTTEASPLVAAGASALIRACRA